VRIAFYLYSLLAAAGIFVSELLVKVHLDAAYGKGGDTGLCGAADGFSCADAANSVYAEIGGLPIAALGMAFYLAVFVMAAVARFKEAQRPALADTFLLGGSLALGYSIFLAIISATVVGKFCPLCMGLYAINLGLFATALATHPARLRGLARMWRAPTTGGFWLTVGVLVAATLVSQGLYAHRAKGAAAAKQQGRESMDELRKPKKFEVATGEAPSRGPADAAIVVVEFSDFQCPYCRRLADALKAVSERMPGQVRYHFKHFPMDSSCNPSVEHSMHQDACRAAVAMVCAGRAGQAWAMHDRMFENQSALGRAELVGYAAGIGIDVEVFTACLDDPSALAVVRSDIAQGMELGVAGTPMWFLNGWRQIGAREPEVLQSMFEQRLRADGK
jgi:protein-disulfide isomerase